MKKIICITILIICLSMSTTALSEVKINTSSLNNKISELKEIELFFSTPQVNYNKNYAEITLHEADSSIISPGKPLLPKIIQIVKFPLGTKIKNIEIVLPEVKQFTILKNINLVPYPLLNYGKMTNILSIFDKVLFKSSEEYPKQWFDYKTSGGLDYSNRVTFLSIQLYPVKYIQTLNRIEYVENMKIKIEYILPVNPQTFPDVYDYLIIAPSEFNYNLNLLVEHKNNHGISTKLVNLEEINGQGRDKQEQIKYFIMESIENWGIKYVLLVGDKTKMPVRYTYPMDLPIHRLLIGDVPTDLYYADIYDSEGKFSSWDSNNDNKFGHGSFFYRDEVDLYPDVSIGRLCCAYNTELSDVIDKIIYYEENGNQEWFNNIVICGGNTHPNWKDYYFLILLNFRIIFGSGKAAYEGEYIGNKVSEILNNFSSEKYYASSVLPGSIYNNLTNENINNAINNGASFVFFIGHGNPETWVTCLPGFFIAKPVPAPEGYKIEQFHALNNENKYPIIIFDACSCADFSTIYSPIAWEAVKLKNKGAIACFGSTDLSFGLPGTWSEKSFNNLIDLGIAKALADGTENVGDLLKSSINNYLNTAYSDYAFDLLNSHIVQIQELFGDPTLKIGGYQ